MRKSIMIVVALFLAVLSGRAAPAGDPPASIPEEFRAKEEAYNCYTGDTRIRLRRFHAIFFLAAEKERKEFADATREQLKTVLDSFSTDFKRRGRRSLNGKSYFQATEVTPEPVVLSGSGATWSNLDKEIERLGIQEEDVVFLWVQAHGEPGDKLVDVKEEAIERAELLKKLKPSAGNEVWLAVLITDRCSPREDGPLAKMGASTPDPREPLVAIWRALYFGHRGVVDIDASSKGQIGLIVGANSVFADSFQEVLNERLVPFNDINKDTDRMILWDDELLDKLKTTTAAKFNKLRTKDPAYFKGLETQTPRKGPGFRVRVNQPHKGPGPARKPSQEPL